MDPSIPGVTAFAFSRLLTPEPGTGPFALTPEGHLCVNVRGEVMTRTEALLACSENLIVRAVARRMQGRMVPDLFQRLVSVAGEGYLVLSRGSERFVPLRLERDLCFFVESYVWALGPDLMWDVGRLPGPRGAARRRLSLLRAAGEGPIALRVPGELVTVKVSRDRPHWILARGLVGWVGDVVPTHAEDPEYLRCEGEGAVFLGLGDQGTPS